LIRTPGPVDLTDAGGSVFCTVTLLTSDPHSGDDCAGSVTL